jgi:formylglycine-generating enzyme required for sulfatase activity
MFRCLLWGILLAFLALMGPSNESRSAPAPLRRKEFTNSIGMKLLRIPAGKFTMGSPMGEPGRAADEHQHEVEITRAFFLGAYEVTQAQYQKVMGVNPSAFAVTGTNQAVVRGKDTTSYPVENVSFANAATFCKKLSELRGEKAVSRVYRLPTEAEWEYACRAGAKKYSRYHYGDSITVEQARFNNNAGGPVKVGSFKPNAWGLYDMHGNVWEWVADWYSADAYKNHTAKDPRGPNTGRFHPSRGGAYFNNDKYLRSAHRGWGGRDDGNPYLGLRVACDVGR